MFESKRIRLRPFTMLDLPQFIEWRNNSEIVLTDEPGIIELKSPEQLENWWQQVVSSDPRMAYGIEIKTSGKLIGSVGFKSVDHKNRNAEFFVVIGDTKYWGRGYAKETMRLWMDYGFGELNLHHLWGQVLGNNKRGLGLYESLGFRVEGTLPEHVWRQRGWVDSVIVGMLSSDISNGREE